MVLNVVSLIVSVIAMVLAILAMIGLGNAAKRMRECSRLITGCIENMDPESNC